MLRIVLAVSALAFLLFYWLLEVVFKNINTQKNTHQQLAIIKGEMTNKTRNTSRWSVKNTLKSRYVYLSIIIFAVAYILFKNLFIAVLLTVIICVALSIYSRMMEKMKEKEVFIFQFREMLISISNSLKAGASLTNAFERCQIEMERQVKKKPTMLLQEVKRINRDLKMGNGVIVTLTAFRERMQIEEVTNFVNAAVITTRMGGNLPEAMNNVCTLIGYRIENKREIESLTASKRSEAKVLTMVPLILVPLLALLAPSYMEPMYKLTVGKLLMVLGIVLLIANYMIGKKIMDIKL